MLSDYRSLGAATIAATLCLAPLGLGLGGCIDSGNGIHLDLVFPDDPALAPVAEEIAQVSLVYWEPGKPTNRITRDVDDVRDNPIDEFAPGQTLRMAVELRTATQRLIGFGRVPTPIPVGDQQGKSFEVEVRRPFVYLGSDTGIEAIDATQEASAGLSSFLRTINLAVPAQVAVPTYDGLELAAVLTRQPTPGGPLVSELMVMPTDNHTPNDQIPTVPLAAPASDLALSADGRYAFVGHEATAGATPQAGGVSVIDLKALRDDNQVVVSTLDIGSVGRLSVGVEKADRVFALVNPLQEFNETSCTSDVGSTLVEILVEPGKAPSVGRQVPLPRLAQDLAAADDASFVVVADSCSSALWRVSMRDLSRSELLKLDNVSAVALWNNNIWAVSSQVPPGDRTVNGNAEIRVVSLDLQGKTVAEIPLPPMRLAVEAPVFSSDGQVATLQVTADGVHAFDLAVAPGAGAVALLMNNTYYVQQDSGTSQTFIPNMDIATTEYLLVDVANTTAVQHVVNQCDIKSETGAVINQWRCAQSLAPGGEAGSNHEVRGLSVLYGSR